MVLRRSLESARPDWGQIRRPNRSVPSQTISWSPSGDHHSQPTGQRRRSPTARPAAADTAAVGAQARPVPSAPATPSSHHPNPAAVRPAARSPARAAGGRVLLAVDEADLVRWRAQQGRLPWPPTLLRAAQRRSWSCRTLLGPGCGWERGRVMIHDPRPVGRPAGRRTHAQPSSAGLPRAPPTRARGWLCRLAYGRTPPFLAARVGADHVC